MHNSNIISKSLALLLSAILLLTVFPMAAFAAEITTTTLPDATVGEEYSETLAASGWTADPATVTWSVESGPLPDGLSLASETGVISGTPETEGSGAFTVKATVAAVGEQAEETATKALTIKVKGAPVEDTENKPPEIGDKTLRYALEDTTGYIGQGVDPGTGIYEGAVIGELIDVDTNKSYDNTDGTEFEYILSKNDSENDLLRVSIPFLRKISLERGLVVGGEINFIAVYKVGDKVVYQMDFTVELISKEGTFTIIFDANTGGGSDDIISKSYTLADGTIKVDNRQPRRSGYRLIGWYTARTGGERVYNDTVFEKNTTLYAHWARLDTDNDDNDDDYDDDSGSGGGSGSGNTSPSTPGSSTDNPQPLTDTGSSTTGLIDNAVSDAIEKAGEGAGTISPRFENVSTVSEEVLDALQNAAGGKNVTAYFDSMNGRSVEVRLYVDPSQITRDINVSASVSNASARSTEATFERYFDNSVKVVSLGQEGSFGANINIAAKIDLTGMDTENLFFYRYNVETNSYTRLTSVQYSIDGNGYLHFMTSFGGKIVISSGELVKI
jgi:uncharacterized repeat protein (TIGR02543 family)